MYSKAFVVPNQFWPNLKTKANINRLYYYNTCSTLYEFGKRNENEHEVYVTNFVFVLGENENENETKIFEKSKNETKMKTRPKVVTNPALEAIPSGSLGRNRRRLLASNGR